MSHTEELTTRLSAGTEFVIVVPYETKRCSATLKIVSVGGGVDPRVDVLGAPVVVDVSYNLIPGMEFSIFAWTNATVRIEGSKQLLLNCYRPTTPPFVRPLVEYHCIIHDARVLADKKALFGPLVLICGTNDAEKHVIGRTLCSYAARTGWSPQLVDLDCGVGQMLGPPGTVCAGVIEYPMTLDEDTTIGPTSVSFFTGSTAPQVKSSSGEWNMYAPYVHYSHLMMSCASNRIARHTGRVSGSSGAVIILPDLKGVSGLLFVEDLLRRFNISHILCIGDDFLFCGLHNRISNMQESAGSRTVASTRIDKLSKSFIYSPLDSGSERIASRLERYFFGGGAIDLQPSEINKRYSSIEILALKDTNGQAVVSNVEQDALEGIVGCVGALFESSTKRDRDILSLSPFAFARVQGVDAQGVSILVSTHSAIPETLVMIIGSYCWVTS
ncbi:polyribonucleotide 5-hydroxyl-kinase [Trypanosoma grayi]|uniref:polyribonucleotide 5-hydroxyl-kinase n=1 Tax=Trypanosoma grayi TaxID=71804 RepID=UPI0004F402FC|nr:polyribonucleotide 5-hydroxyl-kinase [Trypanosoma grayi]KEG06466.1 polyribonucleotide 5-hydroxyl-kinase [Trypanosoma grayi]